MSLTGFVTTGFETLGLNGSGVKPINEGVRVTVDEAKQPEANFWGIFDGLGETIGEGINRVAASEIDRYVKKSRRGVEASPDSTGDPSDNPGSSVVPNSQRSQPGLIQQYQKPLLIAAALMGGYLLLKRR